MSADGARAALVTALAAAVLTGCGGETEIDAVAPTATIQAQAQAQGEGRRQVFSAELSGANVEPRPAPQATGSATIVIRLAAGTACWTFSTGALEQPLSAHLHRASGDELGPVSIPLGSRFEPKGCVLVPKKTLRAVVASPSSHYVDVHTQPQIDGALRGRLHAATG
jgi:hypothetical protein